MKFLQIFLLVVVLNALLQKFLPWWVIAPVGFGAGYFLKSNSLTGFFASFAGVFVLWVGYAFYLDAGNNYILSTKVAQVLGALTGGSRVTLLLLTGLTGGLVSGLAALSGALARKAFTS